MEHAKSRVVVTGACGFIGNSLCEELLKSGYGVVGLDNLSQGKIENIARFAKDKNFTFVQGDVRDFSLFDSAAKDADCIVHLAAYKIPRYSSAMNTLNINSSGIKNALDVAVKHNCKIVAASTSDVYGKNPNIPFGEDSDLVLGPSDVRRWAYAISKILGEHLCFAYKDEFETRFTILRYLGGYGPRQSLTWWGGPQGVFADAIFNGNKVPIHGDGKQTRCFIYINDMVGGTIKAMESKSSDGEILNIGSKEEISILDLAKTIHRVSGVRLPLNIEFVPYEALGKKYEDTRRRVLDVSKAEKLIGFTTKIKLEDGIKMFLEWYRKEKGL